jgi:multiple sugar transport system ATP-binding protein
MGIRPRAPQGRCPGRGRGAAQRPDLLGGGRRAEWLGSEELAYFRVQGARASARELEELAADSGSTDVPQAGDQLVARLDPAGRAREGEKLELWVDPHKAQPFNPQNGAHLTL